MSKPKGERYTVAVDFDGVLHSYRRVSKPKNERYTVAVDFDGVLHSYTSPWVNEHTIPDGPVPGAVEWLLEIAKHFHVVIFTTRGRTLAGKLAVQGWLRQLGVHVAEEDVTFEKPAALVYIDDRAWRFEGRFPTRQEIHEARPWNKPKVSA